MVTVNPNEYLETIKRLEPDITSIDSGAFYASAAISLKRIADAMTGKLSAADCGRVVAISNDYLPLATSGEMFRRLNEAGFVLIRKR